MVRIQKAQKVNMGGILIDQPLPAPGVESVDPVLLIHHWKGVFPGGQKQADVGVGPHPHRGFAPVSFIFQGGVHHRDSMGNDTRVMPGGVQWMNAGSGVVHSERPLKEIAEEGGEHELIQMWINIPAARKMNAPDFYNLNADAIPKKSLAKGQIQVIAGAWENIQGPVQPLSTMTVLRLDLQPGFNHTFVVPKGQRALCYVLNGTLQLNNEQLSDRTMAWSDDDRQWAIETRSAVQMLLVMAVPIAEPVVSYGPFVMNTHTEITRALRDAQAGKMGQLTEDFS